MKHHILLIVALLLFLHSPLWASQDKDSIYHGHRSSSYSLPALVIAAIQRPDFIELPLLLTRDNVPVVYDDLLLNPQTDVADIFPGRSRQDGNFYLVDFTLAEIRQLSLPGQEGYQGATAHLASLDDALSLLSHVDTIFATASKILPVIKYPWFHASEDRDISSIVLDNVIAHSNSADAVIHLKCYDPGELQRIHKDLLPGLPVEVRLIQGIDAAGGREAMQRQREKWSSYNYDWFFTRLGLRVASGYAYALMLKDAEMVEEEILNRLITDSHGLKMKIFITSPQHFATEPQAFYERMLFTSNADGLALENPAQLAEFLKQRTGLERKTENPRPAENDENDPSGILIDTEALLERLKKIQ